MPLVVPGLMTSDGSKNQQEDWMNKLVGKKITEGTSDEMVRVTYPVLRMAESAVLLADPCM